MKAIRVHEFGGPEVLQLEDVPDPVAGPGQVVVRLQAVGVNPVETYVRTGRYPKLPPLPYTPGTDGAGVVESVGEGVTDLQPGDRVYIYGSLTGAYAEKALCMRAQVFSLPERATLQQGAAIGVPVGAGWRALFTRGDAKAGETVLVHGATGSVGLAVVQFARAAGLVVVGTAGSDEGRQILTEHGAHHAVAHEIVEDLAQVKALTNGRGFDLIIEMLANVNLARDLPALRLHGRVVVVGSRGSLEFDPRLTMGTELDIRGMSLPNATPEELAGMHLAIRAALENGTLRPIIAKELPLKDAGVAHKEVSEGGLNGKIVLVL
jgi:NADPH2:quinone reductase